MPGLLLPITGEELLIGALASVAVGFILYAILGSGGPGPSGGGGSTTLDGGKR